MQWLSAGFSLGIAAAGWHYLFFSQAALRLHGVEQGSDNRVRIALRRVGGACMIALAVCFYFLFHLIDSSRSIGPSALAGWIIALVLAVMLLLLSVTALALVDLRLTWKLRRK